MKLQFSQKERVTGFFKKKTYYASVVHVEFTEAEREVLKDKDVQNLVIHESEPDAMIWDNTPKYARDQPHLYYLRISSFLSAEKDKDGMIRYFRVPSDVVQYQDEFMKYAKRMKSFLDENMGGLVKETRTVEL